MDSPSVAKFEVTDHFEIRKRGGVVAGLIRAGTIKIGCSLRLPSGHYWTIKAIESVDNLSERTHRTALLFRERPSRMDVERAFPKGALIEVYDAA